MWYPMESKIFDFYYWKSTNIQYEILKLYVSLTLL